MEYIREIINNENYFEYILDKKIDIRTIEHEGNIVTINDSFYTMRYDGNDFTITYNQLKDLKNKIVDNEILDNLIVTLEEE